jgi:hypothetical protein
MHTDSEELATWATATAMALGTIIALPAMIVKYATKTFTCNTWKGLKEYYTISRL